MDKQLTSYPDVLPEHQLVLLPKDRKSGAQLPIRRSQRIKNATAARQEYTAALRAHKERKEELLERFLDLKEEKLEDDQRYIDWESGRVAKEERTLAWEKTNEGKG
jgi:hypothetical protein